MNDISKLNVVNAEAEEPWIDTNGSTCGDVSIGTEASVQRTWETGIEAYPYVTLTVTWYVEAHLFKDVATGEPDREVRSPMDFDDWDEADKDKVRYSIESRQDWLAHTDADEPGSTEITSEFEYGEGGIHDWWLDTIEIANEKVVAQAKGWNWELIYPENWKILKPKEANQ